MITMSTHGTNGRLGNQIMQLMAMIGLAKDTNQKLSMPGWKYQKYFNLSKTWRITDINHSSLINVHEKEFHYDKNFKSLLNDGGNYNVKGYFQTEKYWSNYKEEILTEFTWNKDFHNGIYNKYKILFEKRTIAIHVRRGDYVNNKSYHNLNINYYISALSLFPFMRQHNILVFSDDPDYCQLHFGCLENVTIMRGNTDIEDMCLMSMCDNFILSNSTFAWAAAYLSNVSGKVIIRPAYYFNGTYADSHDTKDFWPDDWIVCDHMTNGIVNRIPLKDMTFVIPFYRDHTDRLENLTANLRQLLNHFDTNVIVGEWGEQTIKVPEVTYHLFESDSGIMHRTKMINDMIKMSQTKFVANWDADIFITPIQILDAMHKLNQNIDFVYPYDGTFNRVQRKYYIDILNESNDVGMFSGIKFESLQSVGGAVFYNKQSFIEAGMENENMISYGPEDAERYERFKKLGYSIEFQKGELYHVEHFKGLNSLKTHPHINKNRRERNKVNAMRKPELLNYIQTWKWVQ